MEYRKLKRAYPFLGLAGSLLIFLATLATALAYQGTHGELYSPLNHFISELGEVGVSRLAPLFNGALIFSGALFVPFCAGLGFRVQSPWGYVAAGVGVLGGIFCAGVGIFPMSNIGPHIKAAMWYFRFGLLTTLLFGIAFLRQPRAMARIPRAAAVFSLIAVASYAAFLLLASLRSGGALNPLDPSAFAHRPVFWLLAAVEWSVFLTTVLWFLGVSVLAFERRGHPTEERSQAPQKA